MKKLKIILIVLMVSASAYSQQIPVSTIFSEDPFAFNPAVAGTNNGFRVRLNTRVQWMGFGDGPFTNVLSAFGPHAVKPMGYGGTIIMDKTGPITMFKARGGYAYNLHVSPDVRASLGLNLGIIQYSVSASSLQFPSHFDQGRLGGNGGSINSGFVTDVLPNANTTMPDAGVGLYIYHYDWYLGISAQHLFPNRLKLWDESAADNTNNLKSHFYGYAGYRIILVNNFVVEPTLLFRAVSNLPVQTDFCGKVIYNNQIWGGISTRNSFKAGDAFRDMSLIMGYIHERRVYVSLAYDIVFGKIRGYTPGSIEIVIGYNFDDLKKGRR